MEVCLSVKWSNKKRPRMDLLCLLGDSGLIVSVQYQGQHSHQDIEGEDGLGQPSDTTSVLAVRPAIRCLHENYGFVRIASCLMGCFLFEPHHLPLGSPIASLACHALISLTSAEEVAAAT